jgi:hypothetical protein
MSERKITFTASGAVVTATKHFRDVIAFGSVSLPPEDAKTAMQRYGWKQIPNTHRDNEAGLVRIARNILTARIFAH